MPAHNKVCEYCGNPYQAKRSDARFCSNSCRAHHRRNGNNRLQSVVNGYKRLSDAPKKPAMSTGGAVISVKNDVTSRPEDITQEDLDRYLKGRMALKRLEEQHEADISRINDCAEILLH